jgi:hypothetical protein
MNYEITSVYIRQVSGYSASHLRKIKSSSTIHWPKRFNDEKGIKPATMV